MASFDILRSRWMYSQVKDDTIDMGYCITESSSSCNCILVYPYDVPGVPTVS